MKQPTILVTGCGGQIGWELVRTLAPIGRIVAVDVDRLDLTRPDRIRSFVREIDGLDLIVHPAAFTDVDGAEDRPEIAGLVNRDAPAVLAEEAKRREIPMIHFSTDYVFDGRKETPYVETDETDPLGVYGRTKRDGELAVCEIAPRHLVFRLCWVYGLRGKNFFLTMLRLARQGIVPKVVDDQFGAPTWSRLIAEAIASVVRTLGEDENFDRWGIYHLSAGGRANWHEFATEIFHWADRRFNLDNEPPVPIPSREYPTRAERPRNSLLCSEKIFETFRVRLPDWKEQFRLAREDWAGDS